MLQDMIDGVLEESFELCAEKDCVQIYEQRFFSYFSSFF